MNKGGSSKSSSKVGKHNKAGDPKPQWMTDDEEDGAIFFHEMEFIEYSTKAYKKFSNYFDALLKTDEFQEWVALLRKKYGMPRNGLPHSLNWRAPIMTSEQYHEMRREIQLYCNQKLLFGWGCFLNVEHYLCFNKSHAFDELGKLLALEYVGGKGDSQNGDDEKRATNKYYPVILRISPAATQNDVVDYVKKMWPLIQTTRTRPRYRFG